MGKFKVTVSDYVFPDLKPEEEILSPLGVEIISGQCQSVEELIKLTQEADALLNCYFKPVGEDVFRASPKLKVRYGIGIDTIDISSATRYGIMVANIPDYCLEEVSDHTIALLFALARKIARSDKKVKEGDYTLGYLKPMFKLQGKTVGFLGFGRIARMVAKKLANFGLKFIFYDPYLKEEEVEKARKVSLQEILSSVDYLLAHTPETKETKHLLNRETLALMKPTACLINTARGGIIDTPALIEMLQSNRLAGAALDIVEGIPPISSDHPLCQMDNVILTPHSAWYSEDALRELQTKAAQEVARVLSGGKPNSLLNPEVLETENFK